MGVATSKWYRGTLRDLSISIRQKLPRTPFRASISIGDYSPMWNGIVPVEPCHGRKYRVADDTGETWKGNAAPLLAGSLSNVVRLQIGNAARASGLTTLPAF